MNLGAIIFLVLYPWGFVMTWRRAAWLVLHDTGPSPLTGRYDGEDIGFSIFFGFIAAIFWPVLAPLYILYQLGGMGVFFRPPRAIAKRQELEEREERIERLERELGIGFPRRR